MAIIYGLLDVLSANFAVNTVENCFISSVSGVLLFVHSDYSKNGE